MTRCDSCWQDKTCCGSSGSLSLWRDTGRKALQTPSQNCRRRKRGPERQPERSKEPLSIYNFSRAHIEQRLSLRMLHFALTNLTLLQSCHIWCAYIVAVLVAASKNQILGNAIGKNLHPSNITQLYAAKRQTTLGETLHRIVRSKRCKVNCQSPALRAAETWNLASCVETNLVPGSPWQAWDLAQYFEIAYSQIKPADGFSDNIS